MHDRDEKERSKEIGAKIAIGVMILLLVYSILASAFTLIFSPEEVEEAFSFLFDIAVNIIALFIANYYYSKIDKIHSGYGMLVFNCFVFILLVSVLLGGIQNIFFLSW